MCLSFLALHWGFCHRRCASFQCIQALFRVRKLIQARVQCNCVLQEIGSGKECESRADSGGVTIEDKKAENGSTKDDDEEDAIWVTCSENAYGAFIYMGITTSLTQAFIKCGPMVVVSILIQAGTIFRTSLPSCFPRPPECHALFLRCQVESPFDY